MPRAATKQMLLTQPFSNGPRDSPGQTVMKVQYPVSGKGTPRLPLYINRVSCLDLRPFCLKRLTAINSNRTCTGQARLYLLAVVNTVHHFMQ